MAIRTIVSKTETYMVRIGGLIKITLMTAIASRWCIAVVAHVTSETFILDEVMAAGQWIEIVVVKAGRNPCCFAVTVCAIQRKLLCLMIGIAGLIIIVYMTTLTCIRSVVVISIMAECTVIFNCKMRSNQRIIIVVVWKHSGLPSWIGGMTDSTIF